MGMGPAPLSEAPIMPFLFIRTTNSDFATLDDGAPYERPEDALAMGIASAVAIVGEDVLEGEGTAAVEICVENEDGEKVLRAVVATSVSRLTTTPAARPIS